MAKPVRTLIGRILIVCVGNICRSPMAEAVLRDALAPHGIRVESAGLAALVDRPAEPHAVTLMHERGIDITAHRARQLNAELLADADLVLVMEKAHKRAIEEHEPTARGKIYRLGEWRDDEIPDPYRQPIEAFEKALASIDAGVEDWLPKLTVGAAASRESIADQITREPFAGAARSNRDQS